MSVAISRGCARKGLVSTVRRCASSGRCHGRLRELLLLLVRGLDGRQSDAGDGFLCWHRVMDGRRRLLLQLLIERSLVRIGSWRLA